MLGTATKAQKEGTSGMPDLDTFFEMYPQQTTEKPDLLPANKATILKKCGVASVMVSLSKRQRSGSGKNMKEENSWTIDLNENGGRKMVTQQSPSASFTYSSNQLTKKSLLSETGAKDVVLCQYDEKGNLLSEKNENQEGNYSYGFDKNNRIISTNAHTYSYDAQGRLTLRVYKDLPNYLTFRKDSITYSIQGEDSVITHYQSYKDLQGQNDVLVDEIRYHPDGRIKSYYLAGSSYSPGFDINGRNVKEFRYHSNGNLSLVKVYPYSNQNREFYRAHYKYHANGLLKEVTINRSMNYTNLTYREKYEFEYTFR